MALPVQMKEKHCIFFVTFLNFLHLIYFIPYRFRHSIKFAPCGGYIIEQSQWRKTISLIINIIVIICYTLSFTYSIWIYANFQRGITPTFYLVSTTSSILSVVSFQIILWRKRKSLEHFVEEMSISCSSEILRKSHILAILVIFAVIIPTCAQCFAQPSPESINSCQFSHFWNTTVLERIRLMGISDGFQTYQCNYACAQFINLASWYTSLIINSVLIMSNTLALSFYALVKYEFCEKVKASYGNVSEIMNHFMKMKETNTLTRSIFGSFLLINYVGFLSVVAEYPNLIFSSIDSAVKAFWWWITIIFVFLAMCWKAVAVRASSLAEDCLRDCITFHQCMSHSCSTEEKVQLLAVGQLMEAEPIGLSSYFYTMTRNLVTSTCGLAMTYGIIIYQMMDKEAITWDKDF